MTLIRGAIQKHKATLLVVDGLISAQESSPTDREFKKFLHEIRRWRISTACTVLLLTNAGAAQRILSGAHDGRRCAASHG